jgi:hypothetical protein
VEQADPPVPEVMRSLSAADAFTRVHEVRAENRRRHDEELRARVEADNQAYLDRKRLSAEAAN